jgi:hypothetical protein
MPCHCESLGAPHSVAQIGRLPSPWAASISCALFICKKVFQASGDVSGSQVEQKQYG